MVNQRSRKKEHSVSEEEEHLRSWAASLLADYPHCLEEGEECPELEECFGEEGAEELRLANSVQLSGYSKKSSKCIPSSRGARRTTLPDVVLEEEENEQ